jgi:hypothetical protein
MEICAVQYQTYQRNAVILKNRGFSSALVYMREDRITEDRVALIWQSPNRRALVRVRTIAQERLDGQTILLPSGVAKEIGLEISDSAKISISIAEQPPAPLRELTLSLPAGCEFEFPQGIGPTVRAGDMVWQEPGKTNVPPYLVQSQSSLVIEHFEPFCPHILGAYQITHETIVRRAVSGSEQGVDLIVLLDVSASMSVPDLRIFSPSHPGSLLPMTRLTVAKKLVNELLLAFCQKHPRGSRVAVLGFADRTRAIFPSSGSELFRPGQISLTLSKAMQEIETVAVRSEPTHLGDALKHAARLLWKPQVENRRGIVFVISDGSYHADLSVSQSHSDSIDVGDDEDDELNGVASGDAIDHGLAALAECGVSEVHAVGISDQRNFDAWCKSQPQMAAPFSKHVPTPQALQRLNEVGNGQFFGLSQGLRFEKVLQTLPSPELEEISVQATSARTSSDPAEIERVLSSYEDAVHCEALPGYEERRRRAHNEIVQRMAEINAAMRALVGEPMWSGDGEHISNITSAVYNAVGNEAHFAAALLAASKGIFGRMMPSVAGKSEGETGTTYRKSWQRFPLKPLTAAIDSTGLVIFCARCFFAHDQSVNSNEGLRKLNRDSAMQLLKTLNPPPDNRTYWSEGHVRLIEQMIALLDQIRDVLTNSNVRTDYELGLKIQQQEIAKEQENNKGKIATASRMSPECRPSKIQNAIVSVGIDKTSITTNATPSCVKWRLIETKSIALSDW